MNTTFGSESLDHLNESIKAALDPCKGLRERSAAMDAEDYLMSPNKL